MGWILVLFWGPFLAALGLERLLCRVTRRRLRPLRLAPLLGLAAPLAASVPAAAGGGKSTGILSVCGKTPGTFPTD